MESWLLLYQQSETNKHGPFQIQEWNIRKNCETCLKLTIKTSERTH